MSLVPSPLSERDLEVTFYFSCVKRDARIVHPKYGIIVEEDGIVVSGDQFHPRTIIHWDPHVGHVARLRPGMKLYFMEDEVPYLEFSLEERESTIAFEGECDVPLPPNQHTEIELADGCTNLFVLPRVLLNVADEGTLAT